MLLIPISIMINAPNFYPLALSKRISLGVNPKWPLVPIMKKKSNVYLLRMAHFVHSKIMSAFLVFAAMLQRNWQLIKHVKDSLLIAWSKQINKGVSYKNVQISQPRSIVYKIIKLINVIMEPNARWKHVKMLQVHWNQMKNAEPTYRLALWMMTFWVVKFDP